MKPVKQKYSTVPLGTSGRVIRQDHTEGDEGWVDTSSMWESVSCFNIWGREASVLFPVLWPNWPPCPEYLIFFQVCAFCPGVFLCLEHFLTSSRTSYLTHLIQLWTILLLMVPSAVWSAYSLCNSGLFWLQVIGPLKGIMGRKEGAHWVREQAIKNWWQVSFLTPPYNFNVRYYLLPNLWLGLTYVRCL